MGVRHVRARKHPCIAHLDIAGGSRHYGNDVLCPPFLQGTELLSLLPKLLISVLQLPPQSLELTRMLLGCCFKCAFRRTFFLRQHLAYKTAASRKHAAPYPAGKQQPQALSNYAQGVRLYLGRGCDDVSQLINLRLRSQDEDAVQAGICVLLMLSLGQALLQIRVQLLLSGSRCQYNLHEGTHCLMLIPTPCTWKHKTCNA